MNAGEIRALLLVSERVGAVVAGVSAGEPSGFHCASAKGGEGEKSSVIPKY